MQAQTAKHFRCIQCMGKLYTPEEKKRICEWHRDEIQRNAIFRPMSASVASMRCIFSLNSPQQKRESEPKTRRSFFPHSACKERGDKSTDASNVCQASTNRNVNMSPCNLQFALSQSFAKSIVTHPIPLLPKKMASLRTPFHQTHYPTAAAVFNLFNSIF